MSGTYIPPAPLVAQGSCLDGVLLALHQGVGASTLARAGLEPRYAYLASFGLLSVDNAEPNIVFAYPERPLTALFGAVNDGALFLQLLRQGRARQPYVERLLCRGDERLVRRNIFTPMRVSDRDRNKDGRAGPRDYGIVVEDIDTERTNIQPNSKAIEQGFRVARILKEPPELPRL